MSGRSTYKESLVFKEGLEKGFLESKRGSCERAGVKQGLWCQGPVRGQGVLVCSRASSCHDLYKFWGLEALGARTKRRGAWVSSHLEERAGKESKQKEE